ncbi:F-box domain-containing protein [Heracleum sosnowskyi]|uniref:F-box domain-containing protein n=1 Tax=Heracleum sosnowskyi TaxID=360622 RepID=A0AAD8M1F1_9APIA|nr:F-box domain-containing protein [Heracleum sosnowskyi]
MGVQIKDMKNTNFKKKNQRKHILDSVPTELLVEIVARVAASSFDDLCNAKFSCKTLHDFDDVDDKYIIRRVSLDKFHIIPWTSNKQAKEAMFLDRCLDSGNPEALYRHGIIQYFGKTEINSGIECLRRAANSGHLVAMYVFGIILILHGGEDKEIGMKIITDMKRSQTRNKIEEIRESFSRTLQLMWVQNTMVVGKARPICCRTHRAANSTFHLWKKFADLECEACCCDQEIINLWEIVPGSI